MNCYLVKTEVEIPHGENGNVITLNQSAIIRASDFIVAGQLALLLDTPPGAAVEWVDEVTLTIPALSITKDIVGIATIESDLEDAMGRYLPIRTQDSLKRLISLLPEPHRVKSPRG